MANKRETQSKSITPQYYYWVDVLRGFAAIAILFWHYNHFSGGDRVLLPFYSTFSLFYEHGEAAVELFWLVSGFVFALVYFRKKGTGKSFFIHRFARLYPLHFLTLVVVAGFQLINLYVLGSFQIYPYNDWYHFILNLLFIPSWGIELGRSFNAPIWSVSVELFIYGVYWFTLPFLDKNRVFLSILLVVIFMTLFLLTLPGSAFWKCGAFFFMGVSILVAHHNLLSSRVGKLVFSFLLLTLGLVVAGTSLYRADIFSLLFSFAGLVSFFACLEDFSIREFGYKIRRIGDLTYGIYLWHIPVQLLLILLVHWFGVTKNTVFTTPFFLLFFLLVFVIANASFVYFEDPARRFIRNRLERR